MQSCLQAAHGSVAKTKRQEGYCNVCCHIHGHEWRCPRSSVQLQTRRCVFTSWHAHTSAHTPVTCSEESSTVNCGNSWDYWVGLKGLRRLTSWKGKRVWLLPLPCSEPRRKKRKQKRSRSARKQNRIVVKIKKIRKRIQF